MMPVIYGYVKAGGKWNAFAILCYNMGNMAEIKETIQKSPGASAVEVGKSVEVRQEKLEKKEKVLEVLEDQKPPEMAKAERAVRTAVAVPVPLAKDPVVTQIENVMAEDLTDLFLSLPPEQQAAFQQKGEETASMIKEIVMQAKVNMKKVFELIRDWLKLLPGVNKFFLEQEAKIKADKILMLAQEEKRRAAEQVA